MPQTNPDLFVSSTYGENGLSVTMKVQTYHTSDAQAPYIHIQLVLEPPTPEPWNVEVWLSRISPTTKYRPGEQEVYSS